MIKTELKENIGKIKQPLKAFWIFSLVILQAFSQQKSADIILIAPTYTMETDRPWADAVVIKGNEIVFVGDKQSAESYKSISTQVIETPDGMVLPGFIDTHVHLLWGGIEMNDSSAMISKSASVSAMA